MYTPTWMSFTGLKYYITENKYYYILTG